MIQTTLEYKLSKDLKENQEFFDEIFGIGKSFDVINRPIKIANRDAILYLVDGFAKDDIMLWIMKTLSEITREDLSTDIEDKLVKRYLNYVEVEAKKDDETDLIVTSVLSGAIALFVDGVNKAFVIDARTYPARGPEEPDIERVSRGSRDGFVETLVFNTALIRRRIRDPKLRMELSTVGVRSRSDIVICYIEDLANPELVVSIKDKIDSINIDGIPMAEKSIEELIVPGSYWNPFPKVRYTERPDVAASHILEGHVIIIVDTSPSVIIAPTTYFHHVQHAEEFRQSPSVGVYLRWVRFLGIFASTFILPLWYIFSTQPHLLPASLKFIGPEKIGKIPLLLQIFSAEIGIDLIRMAAVHTPSPLATALGLIAAFMIGDVAISVGLFAPEVILYAAIAAVGTFATPSYELSLANRFIRYALLLGSAMGIVLIPAIGGLLGFGATLVAVLVFLGIMKSFNIPYLWPLFPLDFKALADILIRPPIAVQNYRAKIMKSKDQRKQRGGVIPVPARKPAQEKAPEKDKDNKLKLKRNWEKK